MRSLRGNAARRAQAAFLADGRFRPRGLSPACGPPAGSQNAACQSAAADGPFLPRIYRLNMTSPRTNRRLFSLGLAACAVLSLAGCAATGAAFQQAAHVSPDKALIYVYRDQAMHGAAFTPDVSINDTTKFALQRGGYYPYVAEPGKVTIKVTNVGSMTKVIDAVAGETYYVKAGMINPDGLGNSLCAGGQNRYRDQGAPGVQADRRLGRWRGSRRTEVAASRAVKPHMPLNRCV